MFVLCGTLLVHAFVRAARATWVAQHGLTAALLLALPLFGALATDKGLPATISARDWTLAGVYLTLLALGLGFGWVARVVHRHRPAAARAADSRAGFAAFGVATLAFVLFALATHPHHRKRFGRPCLR